MKLRDAIDQFVEWKGISSRGSTVSGYASDLKIFCLLLRNKDVTDVSLDDVMGVLTDMMDAGWTNASMMRKCMALRKFFEFLRMQGIVVLSKELIPVPRPERTLPRVADEKSYYKLLSAIPKGGNDGRTLRNRTMIRMLWDTGIRAGELVALNTDDINLKGMYAIVRTEKNRGSRPFRKIFWTPQTNRCLKMWLKKRDTYRPTSSAVFISCTTHKVGQRLLTKGLGEVLRILSKRAGLPYVNPHSFRHHKGHQIIKKGGTNSDIASILGHASLLSTLAYSQLSDTDMEKRAKRFQG